MAKGKFPNPILEVGHEGLTAELHLCRNDKASYWTLNYMTLDDDGQQVIEKSPTNAETVKILLDNTKTAQVSEKVNGLLKNFMKPAGLPVDIPK